MHRIAPVLVLLLVGVASCSSDPDESLATSEPAAISSDTTDSTVPSTSTIETADTSNDDSASTSSETAPSDGSDVEIELLCASYLASITPPRFGDGLAGLAEVLGDDAPAGVLDAIDTLSNPEGDIEAFFTAQNTIDVYVLPICRVGFSSKIVPAGDDATAAELFLTAVKSGDRAGAERLAPDNVVAPFDWGGYPDATSDFSADNSTFTMLLEPTVTVFCQVDAGVIEFCAFSE